MKGIRSIMMVIMSIIILFSLFLISAAVVSAERKEDAVLAEVDGEKITLKEFQEAAKAATQRGEMDLNQKDKLQLIENMIVEKLLYKEALNKKLSEDPAVIKKFEKAKRNILVKHIVEQEVTSRIPPATPEEIAAYYEKIKADFTYPDKAVVELLNVYKSTVLPQTSAVDQAVNHKAKRVEEEARKVAMEIKEALLKGDDMDEIIKRYRALDPENTPWVDQKFISEITKGILYKGTNYDEVVFNLGEGEVGTFEFPDRIMVIRMIKRKPGVVQPLKDVEAAVAGRLGQERWSAKFKDFVSNLKEGAKINVHHDLIK